MRGARHSGHQQWLCHLLCCWACSSLLRSMIALSNTLPAGQWMSHSRDRSKPSEQTSPLVCSLPSVYLCIVFAGSLRCFHFLVQLPDLVSTMMWKLAWHCKPILQIGITVKPTQEGSFGLEVLPLSAQILRGDLGCTCVTTDLCGFHTSTPI